MTTNGNIPTRDNDLGKTDATFTAKLADLSFKYQDIIYNLTQLEYEALKSGIVKNGVQIPIEINSKNEILDGNHRAQICIELGLQDIPVRIHRFGDELEEKIFVINANLQRRQLNEYQKGELYYKLYHFETELEGRTRQISSLNVSTNDYNKLVSCDTNSDSDSDSDPNQVTVKGRTREIIAKKAGMSPATYARAVKIIESGDEPTKERLRSGKTTIGKEHKKIRFEEKRQELRDKSCAIPDLEIEGFQLIHGNFREKCEVIPDNSIDMIFTDPLYAYDHLVDYADLAILASRVLKPGGSLLAYSGSWFIPEVLDSLRKGHGLKYLDKFVVKHNGISKRSIRSNLLEKYKDIHWLVKEGKSLILGGKARNNFIERSEMPDKDLHEYAQSSIEAEYIIDHILSAENQIILDPFMGSGTTGIAALHLKRKFIGIEIDEHRFNVARGRIARAAQEMKQ